jgi:hypothetical protein
LATQDRDAKTLNSNPDAVLRMDRINELGYLPPRGDPHWTLVIKFSALIHKQKPVNPIPQMFIADRVFAQD